MGSEYSGPLVSVIVPVYNSQEFITETVESVTAQSFHDLEIILVDDGSTDATGTLIRLLALNDRRITIHTQPNLGVSEARNSGLNLARGKFIVFLDSDDLLTESAIAECVERLERTAGDIVMFNTLPFASPHASASGPVNERLRALERFYQRSCDVNDVPGLEMLRHLHENGSYLQSPCLYLFRRELLDIYGIRFLPKFIMEDNLFTPQLFASAKSVSYLSENLHRRRVRDNSLSFSRTYSHFASLVSVADELEVWAQKVGLNEKGKGILKTLAIQSRAVAMTDLAKLKNSDRFRASLFLIKRGLRNFPQKRGSRRKVSEGR